MMPNLPRLHLVTDDGVLEVPDFVAWAGRILAAHGPAIALHLRGRDRPGGELLRLAEALAPVAEESGALLLVNDRVDVALAAGAGGVQLGARSIPVGAARRLLGDGAWIGYSAHGAAEAANVVADGADYVIFGTVFPSASHPGGATSGVEGLRDAIEAAGAPVVAIGGITPERVAAVRATGAHGVAVLGGVWRAERPVDAVARYLVAIGEGS
jgi:thiamine-phosphate diphosphorylase